MILSIALPVPISDRFDYLAGDVAGTDNLEGKRVRVSFGRQTLVGVIAATSDSSEIPLNKLKPIEALLDEQPILTPVLFKLIRQVARYYHHPLGEVVATALPVMLRNGERQDSTDAEIWRMKNPVDEEILAQLTRAPKQLSCFKELLSHPQGLSRPALDVRLGTRSTPSLKALLDKGLVYRQRLPALPVAGTVPERDVPPRLHDEQEQASTLVREKINEFGVTLLQGVTGSGKTEVYLSLIEAVLANEKQALVVAPEISLTPQLLDRFRKRFGDCVAVLHSGLNDTERMMAWRSAQQGIARVVVGTRSSVFSSFSSLGLIIIDEEHDPSLKQQEGLRYHARDVAVLRGRIENIPVMLGSATPSLESLHNVSTGRYQIARLTQRAGGAKPPRMHVLDLKRQKLAEGLSRELIEQMRLQIAKGNQVLLFLNRRGYTPILMCSDCGEPVDCPNCDAHTTWHAQSHILRCHHCGFSARPPSECPSCHSRELTAFGLGTQKIEQVVQGTFPNVPVIRIDRDSMRKKHALEEALEAVGRGEYQIIIGTQMLAKGHDFPNITLVGVIDVDQGLFSTDFRAHERLAQQILQVSGRAGRAVQSGEVVLQSHQPEHPLLQSLLNKSYEELAAEMQEERHLAGWPPGSYLALFRGAAQDKSQAEQFLQEVRRCCEATGVTSVDVLGPVSAPMERRAGLYRQQLLIRSTRRNALHQMLDLALPTIRVLKGGRKIRWSLDVDPLDLS